MLLKFSRLAPLVLASVLWIALPRGASAIEPAIHAAPANVVSASTAVTPAYYYYRGRRYPYRYHGMYFGHRYYRYGRWHYY
jgi:hypothetical protein